MVQNPEARRLPSVKLECNLAKKQATSVSNGQVIFFPRP